VSGEIQEAVAATLAAQVLSPSVADEAPQTTDWQFKSVDKEYYNLSELDRRVTNVAGTGFGGTIADGVGCEPMVGGRHYWEVELVAHGNGSGAMMLGVCRPDAPVGLDGDGPAFCNRDDTWMVGVRDEDDGDAAGEGDGGWETMCNSCGGTGCTDFGWRPAEGQRIGLLLDLRPPPEDLDLQPSAAEAQGTTIEVGDTVTTPRGSGRVLKVADERIRVQLEGGPSTWVSADDVQVTEKADDATAAAQAQARAAIAQQAAAAKLGTLTIYRNGSPCGTVAVGLAGPLLPCVVPWHFGTSARIHGNLVPPSASTPPRCKFCSGSPAASCMYCL
jgi:hypothetical protein